MDHREQFREAIAKRVILRAEDGYVLGRRGGRGLQPTWIFDFRTIMLQTRWLDCFAEIFWKRYGKEYPFQVGGFESAGIALVAAIIMKGKECGIDVSGFYVRKSRKRYDLMRRIEGALTKDPVILVDDVVNSGRTLQKHIVELEDAGLAVAKFFGIVAFRPEETYDFTKTHGFDVSTLFTLKDFDMPLLPSKAPEVPHDSFKILWRYRAPKPSFNIVVEKSAPAVDATRLYVGSDAGVFRALSQDSGRVLWEFTVGSHPPDKGILSSPALHEGVAYFGAYDGNVYALDAASGEKRWEYGKADWVGSSPALAPDLGLLFIGLEFGLFRRRGGIVALDLKTGREVWTHRTPSLTHGSPHYIREKRMIVLGSNDGVVYAYSAKTGALLWTYQTGGDVKSSLSYDEKRSAVIFGAMDGICYALDVRDGTPRFATQTGASIYSTPLILGDKAFISSLDKRFYMIDLETGARETYFETSGRIFASPVFADGSLWIGSNDGRLYELDPEKLKLRAFHQFSERIVNAIAYNEKTKRFFVPTVANEMYCIEKRRAGS